MEIASKLFQPFQRMHTSREFPGSGIGQATVNRVLEKHSGRIRAESANDKSVTFLFTIPAPSGLAVPPVAAREAVAVRR